MPPVIARVKTLFTDWFDVLFTPLASVFAGAVTGAPVWVCLVSAAVIWLLQSMVIMLVQVGLPAPLRIGTRSCFRLGPLFIIEVIFSVLSLAGTNPGNQPISERFTLHDEAQDALKALTAALTIKQLHRLSRHVQTLKRLTEETPDRCRASTTSSRRMSFAGRLASRRSLQELRMEKYR